MASRAHFRASSGAAMRLSTLLLALVVGSGVAAAPASEPAHSYPWGEPGCPCSQVLHAGSAAAAGLTPQALGDIDTTIEAAIKQRVTPGAVVLVARRGVIAKLQAYGYAQLYKNADFARVAHPRAMQKDEIFDLASVSKLFTGVAVMQLWDAGKFKLDDPVAKYLPKFAVNGKGAVTIRELLTHTSGFRPDPPTPLYDIKGTRAQRIDNVLEQPLEYPPGTHYVYSDMNFITLGALVEKLSGEREDVYVRQHITGPLHMTDTMYDPPASLKPRIAATEYQPWTHRGMLVGEVDDENSWALGGVAGHAGVFSTASDLAIIGQMMLNGGTYDGVRILSQRAVKLMLTDQTAKYASSRFPGLRNGLGWWLGMPDLTGALYSPDVAGHEGYTGTMLVIDPKNDVVGVLLTNREHPTRNGPSVVTAIRHVFDNIADAIPVVPPDGGSAWFSGYGDYLNRTLTAKLDQAGKTLSFQTWYRTQPDFDFGIIEASPDGVHWSELGQLTGDSKGWKTQSYALPADARYVQFDYRTDNRLNGRGWYVQDVMIDGHKVGTFEPSDWTRRDH